MPLATRGLERFGRDQVEGEQSPSTQALGYHQR